MLAIGALIVAVWFYLSAEKKQKNPWIWVTAGVVIYYIVGTAWMYVILKPLMGYAFYIHGMSTGVAIKASAIVVGLLAGALVHWKFLKRVDP